VFGPPSPASVDQVDRPSSPEQRFALVVLAAIVLVLAAGWTTAWWFVASQREQARSAAEHALTSLATTLAGHAQQAIDGARFTIGHAITRLDALAETDLADPAKLAATLENARQGSDAVRVLSAIDRAGHVIGESSGRGKGVSLAERPHVRAILDDPSSELVVGPAFTAWPAGTRAFPIAMPWRRLDGSLRGAVTGTIAVDYFQDFYSRLRIARDPRIALFHRGGSLLARVPALSDAEMDKADIAGHDILSTHLPAAEQGAFEAASRVDRALRIGAYAAVRGTPLVVAITEDRDLVYAGWERLAWNVLACMTVVSLLLGLLAFIALRQSRTRAQLNAALQHSAEVKRRQAQNRMDFLAHMSHELRTPLNAIIGFAEILSTEMLGPIGNPKYKDCVNDIHDSGRHLLRVINDVLDVAKLDAGKMKLNAHEFDACAVAREVSRMLIGLARKAELALVTETPEDIIILHADERLVRQMLINLIGNAIKFTPAGGEVCVRVEALGPRGVRFTVADTGVGIAPEDLPRVVAPYELAERNAMRSDSDTGLGLPLTKAFAELHRAVFAIDSTPGVGTRVTITFGPERARAAPAAEAEPAPRRAAG
jgi:signal transduction histidine kinase